MFFFLNSPINAIKEEYFVSLDSFEEIETNIFQIVFDGVLKRDFEEYASSNIILSYEKVIPQIFVIKTDEKFFKNVYQDNRNRKNFGKWFILKTSSVETDLIADYSIENSENPLVFQAFIHSIEYLSGNSDILAQLTSFFSWSHFNDGNVRAIKSHLNSIQPDKLNVKLNVYDVGQGSLTAVTDDNNVPLFYFDLGGAWWIFPKSYPKVLKLCFNNTKTVILSHWDLDHVETARRLFYSNPSQLGGITWIAPKQTVSTIYLKLAARMAATGRLLLWSKSYIFNIHFWAGQLIKCNGPEKNHNGIALVVESSNNSIKSILNPGDAAYTYIPNIAKLELDGLVATHHGANFPVFNAPIPITNAGYIVYSHGNKYGHPTPASIADHKSEGWINSLQTPNGHISFTTNPANNVHCNGINCDLSIFQTF